MYETLAMGQVLTIGILTYDIPWRLRKKKAEPGSDKKYGARDAGDGH
jgi:hypothetical protein